MTQLIINVPEKPDEIPVANGQVRANKYGDLVLISEVMKDKYFAIALKTRHIEPLETMSLSPLGPQEVTVKFPEVLNVKISVDVNE